MRHGRARRPLPRTQARDTLTTFPRNRMLPGAGEAVIDFWTVAARVCEWTVSRWGGFSDSPSPGAAAVTRLLAMSTAPPASTNRASDPPRRSAAPGRWQAGARERGRGCCGSPSHDGARFHVAARRTLPLRARRALPAVLHHLRHVRLRDPRDRPRRRAGARMEAINDRDFCPSGWSSTGSRR